jgi:hypothetical protein
MQAGLGEIMLGWPMKNVAGFLNRVGDKNVKIMLQFFGDQLQLRRSSMQNPQTFEKKDLMGMYVYENKSTIFVNEAKDRIDKANLLNQIINWKGSIAGQDFQIVNMPPIIKDFMRSWVGQGADLHEYIREVPPGMPPMAGSQMPQGSKPVPPQVNTSPAPSAPVPSAPGGQA